MINNKKRWTLETKLEVVALHESGMSGTKIAKHIGMAPQTVSDILKRFRNEGLEAAVTTKTRPYKKKYTAAILDQVLRLRQQKMTLKHIAADLNIPMGSMRRVMIEANLHAGGSPRADVLPLPVPRLPRINTMSYCDQNVKKETSCSDKELFNQLQNYGNVEHFHGHQPQPMSESPMVLDQRYFPSYELQNIPLSFFNNEFMALDVCSSRYISS
jgi:transposase-like protein